MKYYRTSEVAKAVGVHPNTVRFYEEWGLLQPVRRAKNNYRLYTQAHMEQMRLIRIALRRGFEEGGLRKLAIPIITTAAGGNLKKALGEAFGYLAYIRSEKTRAEEALVILWQWMNAKSDYYAGSIFLRRGDAAGLLGVTTDALRNWERNGLLTVPRDEKNGYRVYGQEEIDRAKVIRTLRKANYSIMAIMRMLKAVDADRRESDVLEIVSTSQPDEDMVYATDRWILSLSEIAKDAEELIDQIKRMRNPGKRSHA